MHAFDVFTHYEKSHWRMSDIDWDGIRHDLLEPEYVTMAKSAVMGECNSIAAVHGFLNEFVDDYDFAAFTCVWGYQELQHHYAFKSWLRAIGEDVADRPVEATREPYPPGRTPSATLATNVISELTVNKVYASVAKKVKEPVLQSVLTKASRDEAAHAREFIFYVKRRLKEHPEEMLSVLETLYFYTSQDDGIRHPVSVFKDGLDELSNHETIDTGFELFLEQIANDGELQTLQRNVRKAFSTFTELKLESNRDVRAAIAELID